MVEVIQAHFVVLLGAVVVGTVIWAVLSSLVPRRKQKVTLSAALPDDRALPAQRAIAARG